MRKRRSCPPVRSYVSWLARDYHPGMHDLPPSDWVRRFAHLLPAPGPVLDLACGGGRHAKLLAALGYDVEAVDRDRTALSTLANVQGVTTTLLDLETEHWPLTGRSFAGVVVTNYLYRPHFDSLLRMIQPSGVLIYETFMVGNEMFGKPSNPNFLLQPDELLERVQGHFTVVAFEQGRFDVPRPACVQRICAIAKRP